tara:strand:- start:2229 stop:2402 length:174 start_codon:yes stop_codon:yes gene_type:complete
MKIDSEALDKRFERIEATLDSIKHNHLHHIERYTKWTLVGIAFSVSASLTAIILTVV